MRQVSFSVNDSTCFYRGEKAARLLGCLQLGKFGRIFLGQRLRPTSFEHRPPYADQLRYPLAGLNLQERSSR